MCKVIFGWELGTEKAFREPIRARNGS
jgi:hypothetical protein